MRTLLVFIACSLAAVMAAPPQNKGIFINLENGELCFNSLQCKSSCCHRTSGVSLARCVYLAADKQECSVKTLYGTYYRCPCESGLKCKSGISIGGSITNTNFGVCYDPSEVSVTRQNLLKQTHPVPLNSSSTLLLTLTNGSAVADAVSLKHRTAWMTSSQHSWIAMEWSDPSPPPLLYQINQCFATDLLHASCFTHSVITDSYLIIHIVLT
ncbi:colipase-like [Huso huso]|uniref:Colipase-like n=1 Tax=Huso huso TaxID=61971 RepID=A0ABR0Y067_HUSHU